MTHMSVEANEELVEVFRNILTYRVSNSIKEYMADIAEKMEREYALKFLEVLRAGPEAEMPEEHIINH